VRRVAGLFLALVLAVGSGASAGAAVRRVPPGVTVGGRSLGGLGPAEARAVLEALAAQVDEAPEEPSVDPATGGLVPGLDGLRLDVGATLARALAARPGTRVAPVLVAVPPRRGLEALPPRPIYHGSRRKAAVALVVNVAWGEPYLLPMAETLARLAAPVTLCLVGRWAESHADLVRQVAATLARARVPVAYCNHGYRDHGWLHLTEAEAAASIQRADQAIRAVAGVVPRFFSPHRGEWTPAVLAASRATGHELVLWSVDSIDWRGDATAARVEARVLRKVGPGDIVLLHPTAATAAALAVLVAGIRAKGLALVTLDALLSPARIPGAPPATTR
jgi:peptidoglycan/xylan/chitin deacetylase (PgdA/CDA1 family)